MLPPATTVPGGIRPSAVVVLAFALLIGGVLLAVESISVEDQMRTSYEEALALSHLALETQQASTQLRNDQVRAARSLAQMTLLPPAGDAVQLQAAVTRLGGKLEEIGGFHLSAEEGSLLAELKNTIKSIGDINTRFADARRRSAAQTPALQRPTDVFHPAASPLTSASLVCVCRSIGARRWRY